MQDATTEGWSEGSRNSLNDDHSSSQPSSPQGEKLRKKTGYMTTIAAYALRG